MIRRRIHIPVRDIPRLSRRATMPEPAQLEYRAGWRYGVICGALAAALVIIIVFEAVR